MLIEINFLEEKVNLDLRKMEDKTYVFDPIRKKNIVLTPEELLRQLILLHLINKQEYPIHRIRVEYGIKINTLQKRCDIVVFDPHLQPWLLIECKSPKTKLNQTVFEQIAAYNLQLQAPYLMVTNGLATYACALDFEQASFRYLDALPVFRAT